MCEHQDEGNGAHSSVVSRNAARCPSRWRSLRCPRPCSHGTGRHRRWRRSSTRSGSRPARSGAGARRRGDRGARRGVRLPAARGRRAVPRRRGAALSARAARRGRRSAPAQDEGDCSRSGRPARRDRGWDGPVRRGSARARRALQRGRHRLAHVPRPAGHRGARGAARRRARGRGPEDRFRGSGGRDVAAAPLRAGAAHARDADRPRRAQRDRHRRHTGGSAARNLRNPGGRRGARAARGARNRAPNPRDPALFRGRRPASGARRRDRGRPGHRLTAAPGPGASRRDRRLARLRADRRAWARRLRGGRLCGRRPDAVPDQARRNRDAAGRRCGPGDRRPTRRRRSSPSRSGRCSAGCS